MKRRIAILLFSVSCMAFLMAGCGKEDTNTTDIPVEPTAAQQDTLDLFDAYLECNDLISARTLADTVFTEESFFTSAERRLEKREGKILGYLDVMTQALTLFGDPATQTEQNFTYGQIYEFEQSEEFMGLLEYVGKNGSFCYVPHSTLSDSYDAFSEETAVGISFYTYKGCDCIYWYVGEYTGTDRSHGNWIHVEEHTANAILDADYVNMIVLPEEEEEQEQLLTDEEEVVPEEESEAQKDAEEAEINIDDENIETENVMADGVITEYFYTDGILTKTISGEIISGKYDGEVTFTDYTEKGTLTGTAMAANGIYERINAAITEAEETAEEEIADIAEAEYVYAAMYDEEGLLQSFKVSETQGIAEIMHNTICPDSYLVYATKREGMVTTFPCIDSSSLSYMTVQFYTAIGNEILFTVTAPGSITTSSGSNNVTLVLSSEDERIKLSSWCYSTLIDDEEDRLINLEEDRILNWLDTKTTYTEGNYFRTEEIKPAFSSSLFYPDKTEDTKIEPVTINHEKMGRTIVRITNVSATGITYEGYMIVIDNYASGERYFFNYLVERSIFNEENALEVAKSITVIE